MAELVEPIDAALDQIAPLGRLAGLVDRRRAVRSRQDHGLNAAVDEIVADFVAVVPPVSKEAFGINIVKLHQRLNAFDLVVLTMGSTSVYL